MFGGPGRASDTADQSAERGVYASTGEKQIEIIVPEVDQLEVDRIKALVEDAGVLYFAIVANNLQHAGQMELAAAQAEAGGQEATRASVLNSSGEKIAIWASLDREKKGEPGKADPFRVDIEPDC